MTTYINADIHPGATQVPPWVIRFARKETDAGEEWLVLADQSVSRSLHRCGRSFRHRPRYNIKTSRGFHQSSCCGALEIAPQGLHLRTGSLTEAHAAFERIEEQWIRGDL